MPENEPQNQYPSKEPDQRVDILELMNDFEMSGKFDPILRIARIKPNLINMFLDEARKRIDIIDDFVLRHKGGYSEEEVALIDDLNELQNQLGNLLKNND